jgi:hypothetical protein
MMLFGFRMAQKLLLDLSVFLLCPFQVIYLLITARHDDEVRARGDHAYTIKGSGLLVSV